MEHGRDLAGGGMDGNDEDLEQLSQCALSQATGTNTDAFRLVHDVFQKDIQFVAKECRRSLLKMVCLQLAGPSENHARNALGVLAGFMSSAGGGAAAAFDDDSELDSMVPMTQVGWHLAVAI
jgi:hypothetical protein